MTMFHGGECRAFDERGRPKLMVADDGRSGSTLDNLGVAREHGGVKYRIAQFVPRTLRALRGMGYKLRVNEFTGYLWPGRFTPYDHQKVTAKFMVKHKRPWCLNEMRTGKTTAVAHAAIRLHQLGDIKRVLVLCPRGIMKTSWRRELRFIDGAIEPYLTDKSVDHLRMALADGKTDWVIMNHDKLRYVPAALVKWKPDLIIIDESTEYRGLKASRVKALHNIVDALPHVRVWPLTGTPIPNGPMDVWGIGRVMRPDLVPKYYSIWRRQTMIQVTQNRWIPTATGMEMARKVLENSICVKARDCMDMPEMVYSYRQVDLHAQCKKWIKQLADDTSIYINAHGGRVSNIVARVAPVLAMRKLQMKSGVVTGEDGVPIVVGAKSRLKELIAIVREVGDDKIVVLCPFVATQYYIRDQLAKEAIISECLNGRMSGKVQEQIRERFDMPSGPQVLIMHPKVGQYGLNLSVADYSVWWIPTMSNLQYQQVNQRIVAPGKPTTSCIHLYCDAEEERYYKKLQAGELTQSDILNTL